jgi:hypothetical protein
MTAVLCAHYGMPAVQGFLHNGVPPGVAESLGPAERYHRLNDEKK